MRAGSIPSTISTARTEPSSTASGFPHAKLQSGDVLVFGDAEFTFNAPQSERASSMVTQIMDAAGWREPEGAADDTIYLVRRMHAMLMNRCLRVRFEPIVRLDQGGLFGHEMIDGLSAAPSNLAAEQRRLMQIDCQLTARLRQLQRMIAAEEAGEFSAGATCSCPWQAPRSAAND